MSQESTTWINTCKKWDGLTWVVIPLLFLEKFVKIVSSELLDAYTKWDHQRFNNSLPKE